MKSSFSITKIILLLLFLLLLLLTPNTVHAGVFMKTETNNNNNLYNILGLTRDASKEEIKKAFRKITREHHPDLQETFEAKEKAKEYMVKVLHAYNILSDDIQRQNYDDYGSIPGEEPNPSDFTAQELFEYFHQHSPILSITKQLESIRALRRILNFRGNRLFLIQIYDDSCTSCRWFGQTWESFAQSSLIESNIVEMLRIDTYSPEASELLNILGIKYSREVQVIAIIDGKQWPMPQLDGAIKTKSNRAAFKGLTEFVMNFFYDKITEIKSMEATTNNSETIIKWLQEERSNKDSIRILVPPLIQDSILLSLSLLYDDLAIFRLVPRNPLIDFIENYCGKPVEVRDRKGEIIPMPEFIVLSTEQLPISDNNNNNNISSEDLQTTRSCRGVTVGASSALTFKKADIFVKESLPPKHFEMIGISHITSMLFYEFCRRHCLLWLRYNCNSEPNKIWLKALQSDYKPFNVGYICLNDENDLRSELSITLNDTLVAIIDGDEDNLHVIHGEPEPRRIAEILSNLLQEEIKETKKEEEEDKINNNNYNNINFIHLTKPLSLLLTFKPFYLSQWLFLYLCFEKMYFALHPFISNAYPFFVMFIAHKCLQRFGLLGDNASRENSGNQGGTTANNNNNDNSNNNNNNRANTTRNNSNNNNNKPKTNSGFQIYTSADLEEAKIKKGFLILLYSQSDISLLVLPSIAKDARFTVRIIPETETVWKTWVKQHIAYEEEKEEEEFNNNNKYKLKSNKETTIYVVAIRQGKMKAAVKPLNAEIDSWLCDLLDGTVMANASLPEI